jgi:predicted dienelactone hydrolase
MRPLTALVSIGLLFTAASASAENAGFRILTVPDGQDAPLQVGVWYPTDAPASPQPLELSTQTVAPGAPVDGRGHPLIVISHGSGGWLGEHLDTAIALARAGFVVAAPTHTGDNYKDMSRAIRLAGRPQQVHAVIDYMLQAWPDHDRIDASKVGLFGFSAGGFTTLVVAGAEPDLGKIREHCAAHPDFFECQLLKRAAQAGSAQAGSAQASSAPAGADPVASRPAVSTAWDHDARVKAVVVAAPALGYTFAPDGLKGVAVPVQLWRASEDSVLRDPYYVEPVRDSLLGRADYHVVDGADHMDFMAPCSEALAKAVPVICREGKGFDRAAFHEAFNRDVVAFFAAKLGAP